MSCRWFMPVNVLFTFIIGTLLGWIVIVITKPPPHLRGLIVGCCAAGTLLLTWWTCLISRSIVYECYSKWNFLMKPKTGNLGNMPLIIIPAVCKDKGGPFGDPESCHKYGMGYVALSLAVSTLCLSFFFFFFNGFYQCIMTQLGNVSDWSSLLMDLRIQSYTCAI